jgi:energy-coupling factor transporter ATP-binding protein EcfA2
MAEYPVLLAGAEQTDVTERAIDYVLADGPLDTDGSLGLDLPAASKEVERGRKIKDLITAYEKRGDVKRPLSIAVFGPPGSGKSTIVRALLGAPKPKPDEKPADKLTTVNLSQLTDPSELDRYFCQGASDDRSARFFFFDEFDTSLDNVPLGWLRWFLAPMQDGEFFTNGKKVAIGKAVFVFAGGTAASRDEFEQRASLDEASYRALKVPDFMSRLRAFMDIQGVNNFDDERAVRRALILKYNLKRWEDKRQNGQFPLDPVFVRSILSGAHFVHGARSIEALIDMSELDVKAKTLQLPPAEILKLHVSRGPLDGQVIGLSAGQDETGGAFITAMTEGLLQHGATFAYGGNYVPRGPLEFVVGAAANAPRELVERTDKCVRNYLAFPTFLHEETAEHRKSSGDSVEFITLDSVGDTEKRDLGVPGGWFEARRDPYDPKHHVAWALGLFRMRLRMAQDISALIVLGGKSGSSWGRFSGIAEEVMLAMALGKPVYVLGGYQGGARAIGRVLGLDRCVPPIMNELTDEDRADFRGALEQYAEAFRIPGRDDSPLTVQDVRRFLFDRSITTAAWPWNGLTIDQNRDLFALPLGEANEIKRAVGLVIRGLTRLDWKTPRSVPRR